MVVGFFHDGPVYRDCEGNYHNGVLNDEIISRYFYLADQFVGVTRIYKIEGKDEKTVIHHPNVTFVEVPNLNTIKGRFREKKKCERIVDEQVKRCDYVIARVPSYVASQAIHFARVYGIPYMAEVVGCPWDSLWNHSWKGKLLAPRSCIGLKKQMKDVPFAVYVTNSFLQKRYPTTGKSIGCSDVELMEMSEEVLDRRLAKIVKMSDNSEIVLGTLANVNMRYKGHDYVIKALARLKKKGITNFRYHLVGGGDASKLRALVGKLGLENEVVFLGALPHQEVFAWLDTIDIYLQPSRTEGLPRALVEAESRALPAIGSNAGGIPELLEADCIFSKGIRADKKLADILMTFNKEMCIEQAKRNFIRAHEYQKEKLEEKRREFMELFVKDTTK